MRPQDHFLLLLSEAVDELYLYRFRAYILSTDKTLQGQLHNKALCCCLSLHWLRLNISNCTCAACWLTLKRMFAGRGLVPNT